MKLLKYAKMLLYARIPLPATTRSVWVNDREPVACMTAPTLPCELADKRQGDHAFPLPGPPETITRSWCPLVASHLG